MALIERLDVTTKATHWKGAIPMNYIYTAGRAGDEFLRRLRDKGELSGTACAACGVVYVPPKTFCERCFARIEADVVPVKARGVVRTFTVCHETYDEKEKSSP